MSNWYKFPSSLTVTEKEYEAGVTAQNIVFGAVLGFVLVGAQDLPIKDFMMLLFISASVVMMIQYIMLSEYKLFNIGSTALVIFLLPTASENLFNLAQVPKLQPTLALWAGMAVVQEMLPRAKPKTKEPQENSV